MAFMYESRDLRYAILNEANERHSGFVIAFQQEIPRRLGFSFLACDDNFTGVVHGESDAGEPFRLAVAADRQSGGVTNLTFVDEYLDKAAHQIAVAPGDLRRAIRRKHFLWRFVGFVNGRLSDRADNGGFWRSLWQRMEKLEVKDLPKHSICSKDIAELMRQLRNCAVEGQIVLDR